MYRIMKCLSSGNCIKEKNLSFICLNQKQYSKSPPTAETFGMQYCLNSVQQNDYENFLCTLLLKGEKRRYAFAVRAFNVEISKISTLVSEDAILKMRLQFWRNSIEKCFNTEMKSYIMDNPVLRELKYTVDRNSLTKIYFNRLIDVRDRPTNKSFLTTKEMEDYAEKSVSSLYFILLQIYQIKDLNVDHAISHLGKAQGITNLIRAIPRQGRSTSINIPQEILIKHGVSQERILRDKIDDKGVENCIFDLASVAHQHLEKARSLSKEIPKSIKPIFLPAVAIDRFLDRLRRVNFRLSDKRLQQRDQLLPLAYYWCKICSKY